MILTFYQSILKRSPSRTPNYTQGCARVPTVVALRWVFTHQASSPPPSLPCRDEVKSIWQEATVHSLLQVMVCEMISLLVPASSGTSTVKRIATSPSDWSQELLQYQTKNTVDPLNICHLDPFQFDSIFWFDQGSSERSERSRYVMVEKQNWKDHVVISLWTFYLKTVFGRFIWRHCYTGGSNEIGYWSFPPFPYDQSV